MSSSSTAPPAANRDRALAFAVALAAACAAPLASASTSDSAPSSSASSSSLSTAAASIRAAARAASRVAPSIPKLYASKSSPPAHLWFAPAPAPSPLSERAVDLLRSACGVVAAASSPSTPPASTAAAAASTPSLAFCSSPSTPPAHLLLRVLRPTSLVSLVRAAVVAAWELMRPGGPLHPDAFRKASGHVALEAALAVVVLVLLSRRQSRPRKGKGGRGVASTEDEQLTEAEVSLLCEEWVPEPLVHSNDAEERAAAEHAAAVAAAASSALAAEDEEREGADAASEAAGATSPSPSRKRQPPPDVHASLLVPPPLALDGVVVSRKGPGPWVTVSPGRPENDLPGYGNLGGRRVLDFASLDFLGLAGDPSIASAAEAAIEKYGVGSCGPRGFYGTIDAHLELERALASFCGTDEAILYSYDLATAPSVLPAFASAKDVVVLDDAAPWPLANGAELSRARVRRFAHGDVASLESVLKRVQDEDAAARRPPCRRFVVVEGVAASDGAVAPLPEIVRLKKKYRYRLVVDESLALGVLGETGRGACEHFGLLPAGVSRSKAGGGKRRPTTPTSSLDKAESDGGESDCGDDDADEIPDVDVVIATLGGALASVGGFCAASREVVDHQRLSGSGYCFSASLPPFLAVAATEALSRLTGGGGEGSDGGGGPARLALVRARASALRSSLVESPPPGLVVVGGGREGGEPTPTATSATVHLRLDPWAFPPGVALDPPTADGLLRRVALDALARDGVLVVASCAGAGPLEARSLVASSSSSSSPLSPPAPSLRLCASASHSEADVRRAAGAVRAAARRVLSKLLLPAALRDARERMATMTMSPTSPPTEGKVDGNESSPSPIRMPPLSPLRSASPLRAKSAELARNGR